MSTSELLATLSGEAGRLFAAALLLGVIDIYKIFLLGVLGFCGVGIIAGILQLTFPHGFWPIFTNNKKNGKNQDSDSQSSHPKTCASGFVSRNSQKGSHPLIDSNNTSALGFFVSVTKQLLNVLLQVVQRLFFGCLSIFGVLWLWSVKAFTFPVRYFFKGVHNYRGAMTLNDKAESQPTQNASLLTDAQSAVGSSDLLDRSSEQIIAEFARTDVALEHASHSLVRSIEAYVSCPPKPSTSQPIIVVSMPASQSMQLNIQPKV